MNRPEWPSDPEKQKQLWLDTQGDYDMAKTKIYQMEGEIQRLKEQRTELDQELDKLKKKTDDQLAALVSKNEKLQTQTQKLEKEMKNKDELLDQQRLDYVGIQDVTEKHLEEQIYDIKFKEQNPEVIPKEMQHMDSRARQILYLKKDLERVKLEKATEVNNIERERFLLREDMRKEMLQKIKETKASMLAMADEHQSTTTRLNLLQNQQLTTELEYQSRQSDKLLESNKKLQSKVQTLTRDVQIHQDVEKQLAKRSHFSQKIIKKLKERVKALEDVQQTGTLQIDTTHSQIEQYQNQQMSAEQVGHRRKIAHSMSDLDPADIKQKKILSPQASMSNRGTGNRPQQEGLVHMLETKIEAMESQLFTTTTSYSNLQAQYKDLTDKFSANFDKYKRAALIMTEFLDDALKGASNDIFGQDLHLDVEKIRRIPVQQLEKGDKVALALVLLKQLQPYLSQATLSTKDNSVMSNSNRKLNQNIVSGSGTPPERSEDYNKRDDIFFENTLDKNEQNNKHTHGTAQSDEGVIHGLLSNIKVNHSQSPLTHAPHTSLMRSGELNNNNSVLRFPPI